jgi:tetratricopeptide (TPR) repeat protein
VDDRQRALARSLVLGLTAAAACLLGSPAHASAPPEVAATDAVRADLWQWRLDEAADAFSAPGGVSSLEREVLRARLDLQRGRHDRVIKRLAPQVGKGGATPELRVILGRALDARGRREEARLVLDPLADDYESGALTGPRNLLWLALSLVANDYPADANDVLREALEASDPPFEARVHWARLFRSRYNHRDASDLLEEALRLRPKDPMALVEMATVDVESDRDYARAIDRLTGVLARAPQCVPAHNLLARIDLENERPAAAVTRLEAESLRLAPGNITALGLLGAAHALLDDDKGFRAAEARALAVHPTMASFYTTASEHLARMHRYGEAAALDERAIALDPRHWKAYTSLGIGRGRLGDDAGARAMLEQAHEGDPYEVRTYNLLERFYDGPVRRFKWVAAPPMRLRVHEDERAVLERVMPPLVQEAYVHHVAAYGVEAKPPLHLEIFPDPEMFSVRSIGLPSLGAHGICFGHLITARSPSAGNFNWAEVLWHELSHVFHIQLSKSRVPRWFTEGLAIYEATDGRPEWRREMDETLVSHRDAGRLRGVAEFNLAFTRARSMEDILVAYYHAYLVAAFIVERHGRPVMPAMLRAWGEKKRTEQVFVDVLGVPSLEDFDAAFGRWLDERLARFYGTLRLSPKIAATELEARTEAAKKTPADATAIARAAEAQLGRGEMERALELAQAALEEDSDHALALLVRGRARYSLDDLAGARSDLSRLISDGKDGLEIRRTLARIAARVHAPDAAIAHLRAALAIDPQQIALYGVLIALLDKGGDTASAYDWRRRALAVDQGNPELVQALLEGASAQAASASDILRWGEMGIHIAPFDADLQTLFAKELVRIGDKSRAAEVVGIALAASPDHKGARALAKDLGL